MRSCPIERRPSALLQPPELQVQTRGPGFLASPILATGFHQGRSRLTVQPGHWVHPGLANSLSSLEFPLSSL
eukprot:6351892-Amphidinium_carterae.1